MGNLQDKVLLLGEGATEFYYFNSLRDILKGLDIKPDHPKHTNMRELENKITDGISKGYHSIFCVIDMDNKCEGAEKKKYYQLKKKFSKPIVKSRSGINCTVRFFETHRCTEMFFLFYFKITSKYYGSQAELLTDLKKFCPEYEKKEQEFFKKCGGLHSYFEKKGGNLLNAIDNADKSLHRRNIDKTNYTYSELGMMLRELGISK